MKRIGKGLQYNVYDLGNGKVLKKSRSRFEQFSISIAWEPYMIFLPWIIFRRMKIASLDAKKSEEFFSKGKFSGGIIGNPKFTSEGVIQDKVIPLKKILGKNFEDNRKIIDGYAKCIIECWKGLDLLWN